MTPAQISQQTGLFLNRFGPTVLRGLDGEALLQLMHGRQNSDSRCLAYWLEFKDDDEFAGYRFGGIGGGSALKFGIYQRQADNAWMTGTPNAQRVLSLEEAISIARRQRDELLAGENILGALDPTNPSDDAYRHLQAEMEKAAPELSSSSWAHKYWFLTHHDRLDDYHNPPHLSGKPRGGDKEDR
jgi:5-methylcytosine-specific restriction protein B